ncbi:glycosyltransferase family 4 protein [Psychrobacter sp. NG254]|uniref:glycosyltransferase family 4 protein n=1 Tax=Psychrobacter sp. NG254 TaxID=2782003 RepID=UPI0018873165|nr:glycosyltransferase family 4 protein [Psychrobacter sp. NG254]MBF2718973.1 glycosyltransferase family 4 protein [Psychrobacter sp. NG254]
MSDINTVLILTNSIDMGGRETRLLEEMKVLTSKSKISLHLINMFNNKSKRATELLSEYALITDYNLSSEVSDISIDFVIDTVARIVSYCHLHNIQALYIHNSDIEALIGSFVAQQLKIPIFCTLHGKGMVFSNRLNPVLHFIFYYLIAPSLSLLITMSYSLKDVIIKYPFSKVQVLPNLVDTEYFNCKVNRDVDISIEKWVIVSRLSIEKYVGILKFIEYAYLSGIKGIDIVGDGTLTDFIKSEVMECGLDSYVTFLGERNVTSELLNQYAVVVGVGRVILEAIANQNLAFVIGTGGNEFMSGFVNEENISELAYENFTGRNLKSLDYEGFQQQLGLVGKIKVEKLRQFVVDNHSSTYLLEEYVNYIGDVEFQDNPLIADLYSSISHFRGAVSTPFYLRNSFISLLENLVCSDFYTTNLERAFILMKSRLENKFMYPNSNHQKKYHLKINRPVLKGDNLLLCNNLEFRKEGTIFKISNYNHDINSNKSYIVFLHFHHKNLIEKEKEKYGVLIQLTLHNLLSCSKVIPSSEVNYISHNQKLGFHRILYFDYDNLRDGIKLILPSNIAITSIKISSLKTGLNINIDKLHVWTTYE